MEKPIDRLIDSVGVATFVTYYKQFYDLHKERTTKNKIAELFGENSENWSDGSMTTKINAGLKIFTLNRELEAIEHILYVKKTGNIPNGIEIKKQAERIRKSLTESWFSNPEEISQTESEKHLTEGKSKTVSVNIYERNIQARKECIEHFGLNCQVCEYNFEDKFGNLGKDFILVHHKIEIATIGKEYKINPITDLIPVCPNCHSMLHKRKPAYTISELKKNIKK
ncbi:MAG: HNH endonuclease [Cellulophaga sp.]